MKGRINLKTILVLVILVLVGVLGVLGVGTAKTLIGSAAAGVEPKNVAAKPEVTEVGGRQEFEARVEWSSEKPSMGVVEYGTTPASLLLRAAEAQQATSHAVKLSPLKSNTSYYFRIKVGDEVFDNNGIPYSFKTKSADIKTTPTIAATPTLASTGGCNRGTDYNKDGVVNSLDYVKCVQGGTTPTPVSTGGCKPGTDYDGNGVVNSLDMMKCLQNKR